MSFNYFNGNRNNNNSNNRNNGNGNLNANGVVIPIGNGAMVTGRVRNGTKIITTVKEKKRKNFTKQTFKIVGESYLPTEQGRRVNNSAGAIKARANKSKD